MVDTHVFLSLALEPERLPLSIRKAVNGAQHRFLSVASAWEISIKYAIGKLPLVEPPAAYVPSRSAELLLQSLPITVRHALRVASLPAFHRDPFDRLLVAQALEEDLMLLTLDPKIMKYGVQALGAEKARRRRTPRSR